MDRPRLLDSTDCLGLTLMWACTRGPACSISRPTKQTTICLVMPTKDEFDSCIASVGEKYPRLAQEK
eukprot:410089-Ditylum_brightwellii.AAC.1